MFTMAQLSKELNNADDFGIRCLLKQFNAAYENGKDWYDACRAVDRSRFYRLRKAADKAIAAEVNEYDFGEQYKNTRDEHLSGQIFRHLLCERQLKAVKAEAARRGII